MVNVYSDKLHTISTVKLGDASQQQEENLMQSARDLGDLYPSRTMTLSIQSKLHANVLKTTVLMFWSGHVRAQTLIQLRICGCSVMIPVQPDRARALLQRRMRKSAVSKCSVSKSMHTNSVMCCNYCQKCIYFILH